MFIKFPLIAAVITLISGTLILIGWTFDIPAMKGIFSFGLPMKPNAAICFVLLGSAILLSNYLPHQASPTLKKISFYLGQGLIVLVGIINVLMLCEYLFHVNFGIDELIFLDSVEKFSSPNPIKNKLEFSFPGRIKLEAVICFLLLTIALIHSENNHRRIVSASLGMFVLAISLATLSAYMTPELGQFGWFGYGIMRTNAAILFAILGAAAVLITWQQNVLSWALNKHITFTFVCSLFLLVLIGFNSSRAQFWLQSTNYEITQNESIENQFRSILISITNAKTNTQGYVMTEGKRFFDAYLDAKEALKKVHDLQKIEFYAEDSTFQNKMIQIEMLVNDQLDWYQSVIMLRKNGELIRNEKMRHGVDLFEQLRHTLEQSEQTYQQRISRLKQASNSVPTVLYFLICIGTLVSVITLFVAIFMLNVLECQRQKAQDEIKRMAFYDALTQLPNRRLLHERLQHDIALYQRKGGEHIAVLMLDLDKFKAVNDTLGHAAGDELLIQVAKRITARLRDTDMVARLGGDEFVIVLENLVEQGDAASVAVKIIEDLSLSFKLDEKNTVEIGASIGISFYPKHGCTAEKLISCADEALYQAKHNGRGCFAYFSEEIVVAA